MSLRLFNLIRELKVIPINLNEVGILCLEGALLSALSLEKLVFLDKNNFSTRNILEVASFLL